MRLPDPLASLVHLHRLPDERPLATPRLLRGDPFGPTAQRTQPIAHHGRHLPGPKLRRVAAGLLAVLVALPPAPLTANATTAAPSSDARDPGRPMGDGHLARIALPGCGLAGTGTLGDPYLVATSTDLQCVRDDATYWSASLLQTADLDFTALPAWSHGIGDGTDNGTGTPFSGVYDGGGHSISGLTIQTASDANGVGLFERVSGNTAAIRNLTLTGASVTITAPSTRYVGLLVGFAEGSVTLDTLDVTGSITAGSTAWDVGGVAGYVTGELGVNIGTVTITGVDATVDIALTDGGARAGGIIGTGQHLTIGHTTSAGTVTMRTLYGGTYGYGYGAGGIASSVEWADLHDVGSSVAVKAGGAGGLVGTITSTTVLRAWATGNVDGEETIGGLVGIAFDGSSIEQAHATGTVATQFGGSGVAGGLVGRVYGTAMTDVYTRGNVFAGYAGGIVGAISTGTASTLTRGYATGQIYSASYFHRHGGLVGYTDMGATALAYVGTDFWSTTSGPRNADDKWTTNGVAGLDDTYLKAYGTFASGGTDGNITWTAAWPIVDGWEDPATSENAWGICSTANDGFPFLLAEYATAPCEPTPTPTPTPTPSPTPTPTPTPDAPVADFGISGAQGEAPFGVDFTDQSTGEITSWAWDFGDGGSSAVQHPSYTFTTPGTWTVTLTVQGPGGSDTATRDIVVDAPPVAPVAAFSPSATSGPAPLAVDFTDESTGDIQTWAWDFGDGGSSTEQGPSHTFTTPGTYTVTLTVDGPAGSDSTSQDITVGQPVGTPVVTASIAMSTGRLGTTYTPFRLTWAGSIEEPESPVAISGYTVTFSRDGAAWQPLYSGPATSRTTNLLFGHAYRFRVVANADNGASSQAVIVAAAPKIAQSSPRTMHFTPTWSGALDPDASGPGYYWTTAYHATATFTFTGRTIVLAAPTWTNGGRVAIYLDGKLVSTISLRTSSDTAGRQVFRHTFETRGTHTFKVVSVTSGRPIGIDAISWY